MKIVLSQNEASFKQLSKDFITSCKAKGLSDRTIDSYSNHLLCIGNFLDIDRPISNFQKKDIDLIIVAMRDKGLSPNTIATYMRIMAVFFSWCRENGLTSLKIAHYKGVEVIKDTYTDEELKRLLKKPNLKKCTFEEYRSWVIINLLLDCGCRSGTIRAIENRDVDLAKGLISYRHTKNRKVQILPLSSTMVSILTEYKRIRKGDPTDKLFCTAEGIPLTSSALVSSICRYNRRHGVQKTSVHLFRHKEPSFSY